MDYAEMLFAAKVKEMALALSLRDQRISIGLADGPGEPSVLAHCRFADPWEQFIPDILSQLKNTAHAIREIQAKISANAEEKIMTTEDKDDPLMGPFRPVLYGGGVSQNEGYRIEDENGILVKNTCLYELEELKKATALSTLLNSAYIRGREEGGA